MVLARSWGRSGNSLGHCRGAHIDWLTVRRLRRAALEQALQVASYVPQLVLRHYISVPHPLGMPYMEHFPAAVLFADISGFTPLAEKLSQRRSGVTTLTTVINALFEPFIAIISEYGGDVIKFAGDALIVVFPAHSQVTAGAADDSHDEVSGPGSSGIRHRNKHMGRSPRLIAQLALVAVECALQLNAFIESTHSKFDDYPSDSDTPIVRKSSRFASSASTLGRRAPSTRRRSGAMIAARVAKGRWKKVATMSYFLRVAAGAEPGFEEQLPAATELLTQTQGMSLYERYRAYRVAKSVPPTPVGRGVRQVSFGFEDIDEETELEMTGAEATPTEAAFSSSDGVATGGAGSSRSAQIAGSGSAEQTPAPGPRRAFGTHQSRVSSSLEEDATTSPGLTETDSFRQAYSRQRSIDREAPDQSRAGVLRQHRMALKVGVGVGRVTGMHVGGVGGRWEYFVAGPAVKQSTDAEGEAQPGNVVISPETWELLTQHSPLDKALKLQKHLKSGFKIVKGVTQLLFKSGNGSAVPLDDDAARVVAGSPARTAVIALRKERMKIIEGVALNPSVRRMVRSYVQRAVLDRLDALQGEWMGELRKLTILFVMLPDLHKRTHDERTMSPSSSRDFSGDESGTDGVEETKVIDSQRSLDSSFADGNFGTPPRLKGPLARVAGSQLGDGGIGTGSGSTTATPSGVEVEAPSPIPGMISPPTELSPVGFGSDGSESFHIESLRGHDDVGFNASATQIAVAALMEVLNFYKGTVRQFIVDDKGAVFIAAFGLPPFGHPDDERRGVMAAVDMRAELADRGFECNIGVTTGNVYCGNVGSLSRREYAMVGDAVNLSARLMGQSRKNVRALRKARSHMAPPDPEAVEGTWSEPQHILIDKRTSVAAARWVPFYALDKIRVKGKKEPIEVFAPHRELSRRNDDEMGERKAESPGGTSPRKPKLTGRAHEVGLVVAELELLVKYLLAGPSAYRRHPSLGRMSSVVSMHSLVSAGSFTSAHSANTVGAASAGSDESGKAAGADGKEEVHEKTGSSMAPRRPPPLNQAGSGFAISGVTPVAEEEEAHSPSGSRVVSPKSTGGASGFTGARSTLPPSGPSAGRVPLRVPFQPSRGVSSRRLVSVMSRRMNSIAASERNLIARVESERSLESQARSVGQGSSNAGPSPSYAEFSSRATLGTGFGGSSRHVSDSVFSESTMSVRGGGGGTGARATRSARLECLLEFTKEVEHLVHNMNELETLNEDAEDDLGIESGILELRDSRQIAAATSVGAASDESSQVPTPSPSGPMSKGVVSFDASGPLSSSAELEAKIRSASVGDRDEGGGGSGAAKPVKRVTKNRRGSRGSAARRAGGHRQASLRQVTSHRSGAGMSRVMSMRSHATRVSAAGSNVTELPARHTVVMIDGMSGMGRGGLLREIRQAAHNIPEVIVASGVADELRKSPYGCWRQIMVTLFGLDSHADGDAPSPVAVITRLAADAGLDDHTVSLLPLLNDILSLPQDIPETTLTAAMGAASRADNLRHLIVQFVSALLRMRGPNGRVAYAFFVSDAHRMDSGSWAIFLALRRVENLLLIATVNSQEDSADSDLRALMEEPSTLVVTLKPLTREQTNAVLCNETGTRDVDQVISAAVHRRALGVPLFIIQLLRVLQEQELVTVRQGVLTLAPGVKAIDLGQLPDSMQGYFTSRLDRLNSADQLVLKLASVVGHIVSAKVILDIHPEHLASRLHSASDVGEEDGPTIEDITDSLDRLVHHGFLHKKDTVGLNGVSVDDPVVLATMRSALKGSDAISSLSPSSRRLLASASSLHLAPMDKAAAPPPMTGSSYAGRQVSAKNVVGAVPADEVRATTAAASQDGSPHTSRSRSPTTLPPLTVDGATPATDPLRKTPVGHKAMVAGLVVTASEGDLLSQIEDDAAAGTSDTSTPAAAAGGERKDTVAAAAALEVSTGVSVERRAAGATSAPGSPQHVSPAQAALAQKAAEGGAVFYNFVSLAAMEIVYHSLPHTKLQDIHATLAVWYEHNCGGNEHNLRQLAPVLAHHWARTTNSEAALHYLTEATEQSLRKYAIGEAVDNMRLLLGVTASGEVLAPLFTRIELVPEREAYWHRRLASALLDLRHVADAERHCYMALELYGAPAPTERQLNSKVRSLCRQISCPGSRLPGIDYAGIAVALRTLGRIAQLTGNGKLMGYSVLRALDYAVQSGDNVVVARAYGDVSLAAHSLGIKQERAASYGRQSRELVDDLVRECEVHGALDEELADLQLHVTTIECLSHIQAGAWKKASDGLTRASRIAEAIGNSPGWEECVNQLAWVTFIEGDIDEALQLYTVVAKSAMTRDDRQMLAVALMGSCVAHLSLLHVQLAQDCLVDVLRVGTLVEPAAIIRFQGLQAKVLLMSGAENDALRLAIEGAMHLKLTGCKPEQFHLAPGCYAMLDVLLHAINLCHREPVEDGDGDTSGDAEDSKSAPPESSTFSEQDQPAHPQRALKSFRRRIVSGDAKSTIQLVSMDGKESTLMDVGLLFHHAESPLHAVQHLGKTYAGVKPMALYYEARLLAQRKRPKKAIAKLVRAAAIARDLHMRAVTRLIEDETRMLSPELAHGM